MERVTQKRSDPATTASILVVLSSFELAYFFPHGLGPLEALSTRLEIIDPLAITDWSQLAGRSEPAVLLGGWDMPPLPSEPEMLERCLSQVRYFCFLAGSTRKKLPREYLERGMLATNWGDSISRVVAECTLMMILCALRSVTRNHDNMHTPAGWRLPDRPERSLFGRRVGIHGFGKIAQALVQLLKPFGVSIAAYSPLTPHALFHQHGVRACADLPTLFSSSEILVEAAPLVPGTRGTVNRALLSLLPQSAAFINVGRGGLVVEEDLIAVAHEKNLRVCLDVYDQEPLAPHSALRHERSFLLMPHQAGPTLDRCVDAGNFAALQIGRYLRGEALDARITPEIWDLSS